MTQEESLAARDDCLVPISLAFLGTGTSTGVPSMGCLVKPPGECCKTCNLARDPWNHNHRRNTSVVVTLRCSQQALHGDTCHDRRVVIDVGKSFRSSAIAFFPRYGYSRIDGVILTHGHSDAMLGLDDLRDWTLRGHVQPHMDIYCDEPTLQVCRSAFPYLVDTSKATGSGLVAELGFNVFDRNLKFACADYRDWTPLPVLHGPNFWSLGFRFGDTCYISDVGTIPDETWPLLRGTKILIIDALKWESHVSHFSVDDALGVAWRLAEDSLEICYLTGMCHIVEHHELQDYCNAQLMKRVADYPHRNHLLRVVVAWDGLRIPLTAEGLVL
eukprot:Clim_evm24s161 gene=Clim_evmTU24s161